MHRLLKLARTITPFIIATATFLLDQASKTAIVSAIGHSYPPRPIELLGSWLRIDLVTNSGAAFGLFQDRTLFFTAIALIAIPALVVFHNNIPSDKLLARSCVGLLLGGALGNLADRVRYGYVIDFIDVGIGNLRWPTFNIADSAFVVGAIVLTAYLLLKAERGDAGRAS